MFLKQEKPEMNAFEEEKTLADASTIKAFYST